MLLLLLLLLLTPNSLTTRTVFRLPLVACMHTHTHLQKTFYHSHNALSTRHSLFYTLPPHNTILTTLHHKEYYPSHRSLYTSHYISSFTIQPSRTTIKALLITILTSPHHTSLSSSFLHHSTSTIHSEAKEECPLKPSPPQIEVSVYKHMNGSCVKFLLPRFFLLTK